MSIILRFTDWYNQHYPNDPLAEGQEIPLEIEQQYLDYMLDNGGGPELLDAESEIW